MVTLLLHSLRKQSGISPSEPLKRSPRSAIAIPFLPHSAYSAVNSQPFNPITISYVATQSGSAQPLRRVLPTVGRTIRRGEYLKF